MKRLAWLTDIHLDHAGPAACQALWSQVRAAGADAVLLGGDTANAASLERRLREVRDRTGLPVFFVLGNHDCYGGSIARARAVARRLTSEGQGLTWLGAVDVVPLTGTTSLVGHDGWGDGGCGNAATTPVKLNDFLMIDELRHNERRQLLTVIKELGHEAAGHLARVAEAAAQRAPNLVVLTHVPPFSGAAWHEGRVSDDNWLPFFVCRAAGDALRDVVERHPAVSLTVLCGHTHGGGLYEPVPRLSVVTGPAEYGVPTLQRVIDVA